MDGGYSADFSHAFLRELIAKIEGERRLELLGDAESALASGDAVAFLRHDLDVSLACARENAEVEASWGVRATYHVMLRSPFYDPAAERADLEAIARLGHEIGLHFYPEGGATLPAEEVERLADVECRRLEDLLGGPVRSLSFHLPPKSILGAGLRLAGRINAYAKPLLGWYLSDSMGRWREGDPRVSLETPRAKVLQVLTHPIWWGPAHAAPADRLRAFVLARAAATGQSFESVADAMYDHILFRATR